MIRLSLTILLFICCSCSSFSQIKKDIKPTGFDRIPSKIGLKQSDFLELFIKKLNDSVIVVFSDSFIFEGVIVNTIKRFDNFYTIVIASTTMSNTFFSLNQITYKNTVTYTGMIYNKLYDDGFMLKNDNTKNYILEKFSHSIKMQD